MCSPKREAWLNRILKEEKQIKVDGSIKSYYYKDTGYLEDQMLHDILAYADEMPHLVYWSCTAAPRSGNVPGAQMFDTVMPYLANMLDDEREMVEHQLRHIALFYTVTGMDCYEDSFILYMNINDEPHSVVIVAMNMSSEVAEADL